MGKNYNSSRLVNGLTVDASGNVGIGGAVDSSYKLKVTGTTLTTGAATFSSSVTATEGIFSSGGVDGSLGAVVRISTTNTNGNARNWALVNTFENYGDLNFRMSTTQGGNALTAGSTIMTLNRNGYLGLATNNPTAKVHIEGQNWTTGSLSDAWNAPFFKLTPRPAATTASIVMTNAGTSSIMAIQSLSGTTSAEILSLNPYGGDIYMSTNSGNRLVTIKGQSGNGYYGEIRMGNADHSAGIIGKHVVSGQANLEFWTEYYGSGGYQKRMTIEYNGYISMPAIYNGFTTSSAANMYMYTDGGIYRSTSSLKYKQNVQDYTKGLAEVMQLRPVSYEGKSEVDAGKTYAGLIAEEVHDLGLTEFVQYAEDGTPDALAYQNMIALLTKSIQELKAENDELRSILTRNNLQ